MSLRIIAVAVINISNLNSESKLFSPNERFCSVELNNFCGQVGEITRYRILAEF